MFFDKFPLLSRCLIIILLPAFLLGIVSYFLLSRSLPLTEGVLKISDLSDAATIIYDDKGIPTVSTNNDLDAYFALGFCHAQNRLWQMDMGRRTASGQLSEVLGGQSLGSDIYMRTLGLTENAKRVWDNLPAFEKSVLSTYVNGINHGIANLRMLPPEFKLLNFTPDVWKEEDSILIMQLMNVQLSTNLGTELQRSILLQNFGLEKTNDLMPEFNVDDVDYLAVLQKADVSSLASSLPYEFIRPKLYIGSNSWVVSGKHTLNGGAMLANDPHLPNSIPSPFYLARLNGKSLGVSGATIPGLPFVVIGRNNSIAWGMTSMMADTQDLFLEKINPINRYQYEVDGKYLDMEVSIQHIEVKKDFLHQKSEPYKIETRRTENGPILEDIFGAGRGYAYSLRWTGDDEDGGTFSSFLKLNYAKNWSEFTSSLDRYVAPIHTFVYADTRGNIGYLSPGRFPLRGAGIGAIPAAGWLSKNFWQGWIPREEWHQDYNPDDGVIVMANNNTLGDGYPHNIGIDWAPSYRHDRILSLLRIQDKLTAENFKNIQMDIKNPTADKLLPRILKIEVNHPDLHKAIDILKSWDRRMSKESIGAIIYTTWMAHFNRMLLEDEINRLGSAEHSLAHFVQEENPEFINKVLFGNADKWCDNIKTEKQEGCDEILQVSLRYSIDILKKRLGADLDRWQWSDLHHAHFPHFPFSKKKFSPNMPAALGSLWGFLFHRSIDATGGGDTVNVASVNLDESTLFASFYGPSYRQIIDLADKSDNLFGISTGQSGNIFSKHYDDMIKNYQNGKLAEMRSGNSGTVLKLTPLDKGN